MKYFKFLLAVCLILTMKNANAAFQTFTTQSYGAISINTKGGHHATIHTSDGSLGNDLTVNFRIVSNAIISDLKVRALVATSNTGTFGAFGQSAGSGNSLPVALALGNVSNNTLPCNCCVEDALGIPTECATAGGFINANAIAYSGTIAINNGGNLAYNNSNPNEPYFTASIGTGTTDITLDVVTLANNSFQKAPATDLQGAYEAQIFIDNIPD